MINWHRTFGITLIDYFKNTPYEVELERDLSLKQQFLDVAILLKGEPKKLDNPCDGFERLSAYNLLTYKSGHQSLDADAIDELCSYYTGFRKIMEGQLTRANTRLFAIATRFPKGLNQEVPLEEKKPGVYKMMWGDRKVTIIVPKLTRQKQNNAFWHLHSWEKPLVRFGLDHYHWKSQDYSSILKLLDEAYREEGLRMYTMEDFRRENRESVLQELTPEDLQAIPRDKLIQFLSKDAKVSTDQLKKNLGWD